MNGKSFKPGIAQMDEMTQQNAALVEQAAASAQSMQQAVKLGQAVDVFRLSRHDASAVPQIAVAATIPRTAAPRPAAVPKAAAPRFTHPAAPAGGDEVQTSARRTTIPAGDDWEEF